MNEDRSDHDWLRVRKLGLEPQILNRADLPPDHGVQLPGRQGNSFPLS